jgi:magnesium-transporting ATPase (P-type)
MAPDDDNFALIDHAVREGRAGCDNLKITILYILPASVALFVIVETEKAVFRFIGRRAV